MNTTITVYSADWCAYCHAVKDYFDNMGVQYMEKNVEHNPDYAKEAVEKSGQMGIPVVDIDGTVIVGFDKPRIDATLKSKDLLPEK